MEINKSCHTHDSKIGSILQRLIQHICQNMWGSFDRIQHKKVQPDTHGWWQ